MIIFLLLIVYQIIMIATKIPYLKDVEAFEKFLASRMFSRAVILQLNPASLLRFLCRVVMNIQLVYRYKLPHKC